MTSHLTPPSKKAMPIRKRGSNNFQVSKMRVVEDNSVRGSNSSGDKTQDADYVVDVPCLSDELETLILARVPRCEYSKFVCVNKRFLSLLKSGEIYKIRREIGFKEPSVFVFSMGENNWWSFDQHFKSYKKLPVIPSDYNFHNGDKESFCVGTHLFVSGREFNGTAMWTYNLASNKWVKPSSSMITPRCLFASATNGNFAFVAGGLDTTTTCFQRVVLDSAEKYNSENEFWEPLPRMNRKRKSCSGCYMDNKFFVIGGQDENENDLTCGEFYDEVTDTWQLIPDMVKDIPAWLSSRSPPLIAVAKNELYTLDAKSNEVKVYMKGSNTWKKLGTVPVMANAKRGWGVAFKSLGNELLVIGEGSVSHRLRIYTCSPDPFVEELQWTQIQCGTTKLSPFILNCAVMLA